MTVQNTFAAGTGKDQKKNEKQAKAISIQYRKDGYTISGTALPMEQVVLNYLQKLLDGKYRDYETRVSAPTYALGQQKCLGDARNFMVKVVYNSIRYRYDQAYGGDEAKRNKKEVTWTDRFFSAFQQVGAVNIGGMIQPSHTIYRKFTHESFSIFFTSSAMGSNVAKCDDISRLKNSLSIAQRNSSKSIGNISSSSTLPTGQRN